jgi:hypothetical protein
MNDTLINLFVLVDDFCQEFVPKWEKHLITNGLKKRKRTTHLSISEIMTIYIHFQQSQFRNFKQYYLKSICTYNRDLFPDLVSYPRMVSLIKNTIIPLCFFLQGLMGKKTGIYFIDSTSIKACHIKRAKANRVFNELGVRSKSTMGWFFGFKLHLIVNDKGELMAFKVTQGNVDDRKPVPNLVQQLVGKLFGDKGYISHKLFESLYEKGLQLITPIKKNMKNKLMPLCDKLMLRKRAIIETINDQLKNIAQVEHTRHRSIWNFTANILAALCAYSLQPKKPAINYDINLLSIVKS